MIWILGVPGYIGEAFVAEAKSESWIIGRYHGEISITPISGLFSGH
jgi:hypothetical protein